MKAEPGQTSKVIVPGEFPTFNKVLNLSKGHWSHYHKKKKNLTSLVKGIIGNPSFTHERVRAHFKWYRKTNRADPDNIAFAKKYVIDGIVKSGLLAEDRWDNIIKLEDEFGIDKEQPRVEVRITEVEKQ